MAYLDKIEAYIEKHYEKAKNKKYTLSIDECTELSRMALDPKQSTSKAIGLAFQYGYCKGYRARAAEEVKEDK
jgi:hypothetical protein